MKLEGHGQAKILTSVELELLFNEGLTNFRDRALFGVCLYMACRIAEACSMHTADVYYGEQVRSPLIIRKSNTKGKQATRSIPPHPQLEQLLLSYRSEAGFLQLFPGRWGRGHIHPKAADKLLRTACARVGLVGVSTHSFRRTALTSLSNVGTPLRIIQEISGHESLSGLQAYLEVREEQVVSAIHSMKF